MNASLLKLAVKVLLRRKFFTFISLFGIAFTLTVLIVASAFYENSYRPHSPESRSDRFLVVWRMRYTSTDQPGRMWTSQPGYKFLSEYVGKLDGIETMTIHSEAGTVISFKDGRKLEMQMKRTDGHFWDVMDFQFLEGGPYRQEDEENRNFVAVINESTREQYFGGGPAVGKTIVADGQSFRVTGVVRNVPEYRAFPYSDIWVPISTQRSDLYRGLILDDFNATILVANKAAIPKVKADLAAMLPSVPSPRPEDYDTLTTFADTYWEAWARNWRHRGWSNWEPDAGLSSKVWMAAGLILLFMLLPVINLVNINISRIMERSSEIGVRKAFGATSGDLIRQFISENLVLTGIGGLFGLVGAWLVLRAVNAFDFIPYARLEINLTVFGLGILFTLMFGLFSGVYPAWRMSQTDPAAALKGAPQ